MKHEGHSRITFHSQYRACAHSHRNRPSCTRLAAGEVPFQAESEPLGPFEAGEHEEKEPLWTQASEPGAFCKARIAELDIYAVHAPCKTFRTGRAFVNTNACLWYRSQAPKCSMLISQYRSKHYGERPSDNKLELQIHYF